MQAIASSYKDPSGFVFKYKDEAYRAVNECYRAPFEHLVSGGLYNHLLEKKLLIPHIEVEQFPAKPGIFKVLKPLQISTISYAHEWCFSMLKDAAICTLNNAMEAIPFGMILKDANTFNIQFFAGKPILIDTLSFEFYEEKESWIAYRQFCEHFLAPLVLMKYCNVSLNKLLIAYPNGIPLALCKSMLPITARFNLHVYLHIFLQSKVSAKKREKSELKQTFTKSKMLTLLNGLKSFLETLQVSEDKTTWDNYYDETIISKEYLDEKKCIVADFLKQIEFQTLLDLGANEGEFSLLYKKTDKQIIAVDEDRNCIEKLYVFCKENSIQNVVPLIIDLTAPSPSIGWNSEERDAFFRRVKPEVTLALALIHHLVIAHNITFRQVFELLYLLGDYTIIEFVDKSDPKVMQLLENRKDIFEQYNIIDFKKCLLQKFEILKEQQLSQKSRTIFLIKRKGPQ